MAAEPALFDPDPDELYEEHRVLRAEHTALNDRYMRLLMNKARDERAANAAAHRVAWDTVARNYELYLRNRVQEPYRALCGRIEMLPDEASKADYVQRIAALKAAGRHVAADLAREAPVETDALMAEVRRLRSAVREQAEKLHTQHGTDTGEFCSCPGCELIRSVDDVPVQVEAEAA